MLPFARLVGYRVQGLVFVQGLGFRFQCSGLAGLVTGVGVAGWRSGGPKAGSLPKPLLLGVHGLSQFLRVKRAGAEVVRARKVSHVVCVNPNVLRRALAQVLRVTHASIETGIIHVLRIDLLRVHDAGIEVVLPKWDAVIDALIQVLRVQHASIEVGLIQLQCLRTRGATRLES